MQSIICEKIAVISNLVWIILTLQNPKERRTTSSDHRGNGPVSLQNMNISMSSKRALTATGPSQSAVAPRFLTSPLGSHWTRHGRAVYGPVNGDGPVSTGDGPSGNRALVLMTAPEIREYDTPTHQLLW